MISCILGSKDRTQKIKNLLKSVYENYDSIGVEPDIIIVDGGSKPDLIKYLESCRGVTLIKENGLHGVTRAYNKAFRLAKYKYLTWLSDDLVLDPDLFKLASKDLPKMGDLDIISMSMNNNDGNGWHVYKDITPVGFCTKELMKRVDYWSEDYITYASDIDFCLKALSAGGKILKNPSLKMNHFMDSKDELHRVNSGNSDTNRYNRAWAVKKNAPHNLSGRIYPNVHIKALTAKDLIEKIQLVWAEFSWCNIYTDNYHGLEHLKSMNVLLDIGKNINYHIKKGIG